MEDRSGRRLRLFGQDLQGVGACLRARFSLDRPNLGKGRLRDFEGVGVGGRMYLNPVWMSPVGSGWVRAITRFGLSVLRTPSGRETGP